MKSSLKTNVAKVTTDPTAGMESGIRELTEEEMQTASGGNPIGVGVFVTLTAIKTIRFLANSGGQTNAKNQNRNNSETGGFGSDVRIKEDIEKVGFDPTNKVDVYSWRYKSEDQTRYVGVMAQELLGRKDLADSVGIATDGPFEGFYAVDYAKLGLKMTTEQNWQENGLTALRAA